MFGASFTVKFYEKGSLAESLGKIKQKPNVTKYKTIFFYFPLFLSSLSLSFSNKARVHVSASLCSFYFRVNCEPHPALSPDTSLNWNHFLVDLLSMRDPGCGVKVGEEETECFLWLMCGALRHLSLSADGCYFCRRRRDIKHWISGEFPPQGWNSKSVLTQRLHFVGFWTLNNLFFCSVNSCKWGQKEKLNK